MALGAGHAFVFLAKFVYDNRPHEISLGGRLLTRAMFEMPKYPRRPRDQYTATNSKYIGPEIYLSMVKIPIVFGVGVSRP